MAEGQVVMMMGWYQSGWGTYGAMGAGLGMLMMVLVWGAFIALAVWAVTRFTRTNDGGAQVQPTPRAILDRRFAAGEIDLKGYAEARRVLADSDGGHSQ